MNLWNINIFSNLKSFVFLKMFYLCIFLPLIFACLLSRKHDDGGFRSFASTAGPLTQKENKTFFSPTQPKNP